MEAAGTSETSVNFYQATRRNNQEDSHLSTYLLKSLDDQIWPINIDMVILAKYTSGMYYDVREPAASRCWSLTSCWTTYVACKVNYPRLTCLYVVGLKETKWRFILIALQGLLSFVCACAEVHIELVILFACECTYMEDLFLLVIT
jgi:hypothetical protein